MSDHSIAQYLGCYVYTLNIMLLVYIYGSAEIHDQSFATILQCANNISYETVNSLLATIKITVQTVSSYETVI